MTQPGEFEHLIASAPGHPHIIDEEGHKADRAAILNVWADLSQSAARIGVSSGQRVATLLPNTALTPLAILTLAERCSVLPMNDALHLHELTEIIKEARAGTLVAQPGNGLARKLANEMSLSLVELVSGPHFSARFEGAANPDNAYHPKGLVLLTSGSTGAPKRVPIKPQAMLQSAHNIAQHLQLGPDDRAIHALPMFHIGAVVDLFLAPLSAGSGTIVTGGMTPDAIAAACRAHRATWLQLVPTMLARMLADGTTIEGLRFVRTVSADLAPDMQARAEAFFGAPVIQMYGMTETAGQITSNPLPPARTKVGSVGQPAGPEIAILDPTGAHVAQGRQGEVCVKGPTVTQGYEGQDSASHFFGAWLRTGDLGYFDEDQYLFLTGRAKEMINRGGEKIPAVDVERAALEMPEIQEAAAYAIPHPTLGEQVGLAVVAPGSTEAAILTHLSERLAEFKQPRTIRMMGALPRLGSGKIDKRRLASEARLEPQSDATYTGLEAQVAALWARILKAPEPLPDEDFFDAGGDSLSSIEFMEALEAIIKTPVPPNLLFQHPRFRDLVAALPRSEETANTSDGWKNEIRRLIAGWPGQRVTPSGMICATATSGAGQPVFICGQSTAEVMPFQMAIGSDHPAYLMRSPHSVPGKTIEMSAEVGAFYAEEIEQLQPHGPLCFVGLCEGARVLDAAARTLTQRGRDVRFLASFDHWFKRPTPWPVFHIWSDSRRHSARQRFHHPEWAFPVLHPAGARATYLPGNHQDAIHNGDLSGIGTQLRALLNGHETFEPFAQSALGIEQRSHHFSARLSLKSPRLWTGRTKVKVTLQNRAQSAWQASSESGLTVVLHFVNLDGHFRKRNAAVLTFDQSIAPGEHTTLTTSIAYPDTSIPLLLRAETVDQGIGPLGARASRLIWQPGKK